MHLETLKTNHHYGGGKTRIMYYRSNIKLRWILYVLSFFISIVLPSGYCQNAEPRGYFGNRNFVKRVDLLRDSERLDERRFNWNASHNGERVSEENTRSFSSERTSENVDDEDTDPRRMVENKNVAPLLPKHQIKSSSIRQILNAAARISFNEQRREIKSREDTRTRKKNRRAKESGNSGLERGRNVSKNEIGGSGRESQTSTSKGNSDSSLRKSRYSQTRKFRAARRRERKDRNRKRGKKRSRQNDERKYNERRTTNFKKRLLVLQKLDNVFGNVTNITKTFNVSGHDSSSSFSFDAFDTTTKSSNFRVSSTMMANGKKGSSQILSRRGNHGENVERELSKQLEKEIARSGLINLSNQLLVGSTTRYEALSYNEKRKMPNEVMIDDRARFGNSRYDAEKMLGYSRTEEDLPILDLENQVLARTMKDYNAYMTSNLKPRQDKQRAPPPS